MIESFPQEDENGNITWRTADKVMHREDGPAYQSPRLLVWIHTGKYHRTDGPAWISGDRMTYYQCGYRHRTDGPAIIRADGTTEYWIWDTEYTEIEYFLKQCELA